MSGAVYVAALTFDTGFFSTMIGYATTLEDAERLAQGFMLGKAGVPAGETWTGDPALGHRQLRMRHERFGMCWLTVQRVESLSARVDVRE